MKPRRAIHFTEDGRVVTLDICGEKISELCGDWVDVSQRVVEHSDEKTHFETVRSDGTRIDETRESW